MLRPWMSASLVTVMLIRSSASAQGFPASDWQELAPGASYQPRASMATAYDPVHGKLVIFGGYDDAGYFHDTWVFDGQDWTQVPASPSEPGGRASSSMAWDAVSQRLVLFGGFDGEYLGDTWLFDTTTSTWTQANPTSSPKAVAGPNLFTDPVDGHVVVYGGYDGSFYQVTTYRWTGTTWQFLTPSAEPPGRAWCAVANDPVHGNVLLFGGLAKVNPWNTWLWDGSNWAEQSLAVQPDNRYMSAAAFDPQLGGVVLFGGGSGGVDLDDTWLWTGSEWTELHPEQKPSPRELHGMADVPPVGVVVVGGQKGMAVFGGTWALAHHDDFTNIGPGIGGALGAPTLVGGGDLTPGSTEGFFLEIGAAPPSTPLFLFASTSQRAFGFKGGTFYPVPVLVLLPFATDGAGQFKLSAGIPSATTSGLHLVMQAWMPDASAPAAVGGTNGLLGVVP